jgi:hypothetical protein
VRCAPAVGDSPIRKLGRDPDGGLAPRPDYFLFALRLITLIAADKLKQRGDCYAKVRNNGGRRVHSDGGR